MRPLAPRLRRLLAVLPLTLALLVAGAVLAGCGGGDAASGDAASGGGAGAGDSAAAQAGAMAEQHEGDRPEPNVLVSEPLLPVEGTAVAYAETETGAPITGFLAAPTRPDSVLDARGLDPSATDLPGLVVIHEWWGLNDNIRRAALRLAGEGYRVLAVDLYRGEVADTPEEARGLMELALDRPERALANLQAAHAALRQENGAPRVGVLGWCFGGGMALSAALAEPQGLDAAVIYYGRIAGASREDLAALDLPIMGHFGADDGGIPVEQVRAFEEALNELDKNAQIFVYEDAGHAFANPSGTRFVQPAAEQAWDRTTTFLRTHLYPNGGEM